MNMIMMQHSVIDFYDVTLSQKTFMLLLLLNFQEVHSEEIDTDSAYILFYEQQGVNYSQFLPKIDGKKMADTSSMDEDFESDYKKYCVLQWLPPSLPFSQHYTCSLLPPAVVSRLQTHCLSALQHFLHFISNAM